MRITSLYIKNFCSIEEATIDFKNIPMAIIGINNTDEGQQSNGAGKSAILHALFYAIYGDNLRKNLDRKLVRRGTDKAEVEVSIVCPARNVEMIVRRTIPIKGSATLSITFNGVEKPYGTINEGNKIISAWLGITAEDAKTYYIISKENYKSFFTSSNTDKLALISRFINFNDIDKTKEIIDGKVRKLEMEIRSLENKIVASESKIEVYSEQLDNMSVDHLKEQREQELFLIENRILSDKKKIELSQIKIEELKQAIEDKKTLKLSLNENIKNAESELINERNKLEEASAFVETQKEIADEIQKEVDGVKSEKSGKTDDKYKIESQIAKYKSMLTRLNTTLEGAIICPECGHRFLLEEGTTLKETEKRKKEVLKSINEYKEKMDKIISSISEYDSILSEYSTAISEIRTDLNNAKTRFKTIEDKISQKEQNLSYWKREHDSADSVIERMIMQIENHNKDIDVYNDSIKRHVQELDDLREKPLDNLADLQKPIIENINQEERLIEKIKNDIFALNVERENTERWYARFKEFKMYLAVEQIKNIQAEANDTLDAMDSDLRIIIEAFKLDSKGKMKEELTPYIFRDEMETYWYYSGGERARAEIAMILAVQSMINTTNPWGGLHFLYVDEVLDASDPMGIENIIRSLEFLKQPCLITTQISRVRDNIRSIVVTKDNGIANVKFE